MLASERVEMPPVCISFDWAALCGEPRVYGCFCLIAVALFSPGLMQIALEFVDMRGLRSVRCHALVHSEMYEWILNTRPVRLVLEGEFFLRFFRFSERKIGRMRFEYFVWR